MTALLKTWGNKPELRDELISAMREGRIPLKQFQQKWNGDGVERTGFRGILRDHIVAFQRFTLSCKYNLKINLRATHQIINETKQKYSSFVYRNIWRAVFPFIH